MTQEIKLEGLSEEKVSRWEREQKTKNEIGWLKDQDQAVYL